jgi:Ion channel
VLLPFACAVALIFATVFIHTACTAGVLAWLHSLAHDHPALRHPLARAAALGVLVLLMSAAAFLEAALWAGFYVMVDALPRFEDALYFSLVTFTTLGYGDLTLHGEWRLLAACEAANGILMFGWTTALIVTVGQRVFIPHPPHSEGA